MDYIGIAEAEVLLIHGNCIIDHFDKAEFLKIPGNSYQRRKHAIATFHLNKTRGVG